MYGGRQIVNYASLSTEDSVNLMPVLTGERQDTPHDYMYRRAGPTIAIRDAR